MRYGWNLAHGKGLVWNSGERVEGITNLLWALQASVFSAFLSKRFVPLAMQLSAIGWLFATAWCFRHIAKTFYPSATSAIGCATRVIAFLLPLSYSPLVVWALRGMETSLQAALIAGAVFAFLRAHARPSLLGSLLLGLACATRFDCIVPSAVILGIRFVAVLLKKHCWQDLLWETLPFVSILIALTLFRLIYYGSPLPNTYTLKVEGMSLFVRIRINSIGYISPFVTMSLPVFLIAGLRMLLRPTASKLTLVSLPISTLAYTIYVGGDAFENWRFMAPYMPFVFLALLLDLPHIDAALSARWAHDRFGRVRCRLCIALAVVLLLTIARPPIFKSYMATLRGPQEDDVANINTAIWLKRVLHPSASVGVFYAGSVPFYTDFYAYDFLGKCDKHIAKLPPDKSGSVSWSGLMSVPGHNKYDLAYSILKIQPTYVQGLIWGRQNVTKEALEPYQPVVVPLVAWLSFSRRHILLRKGSPHVRWDQIDAQTIESGRPE